MKTPGYSRSFPHREIRAWLGFVWIGLLLTTSACQIKVHHQQKKYGSTDRSRVTYVPPQVRLYSQTLSITDNDDDGYALAGSMHLPSGSSNIIGAGIRSEGQAWMYLRFLLTTAIPAGARVSDTSRLNLWGMGSVNWDSSRMSLRIVADHHPNPPRVSLASQVPGQGKAHLPTHGFVIWRTGTGLTINANAWNESPSLAPIIQELVNTYGGLAAGTAIQFWVTKYDFNSVSLAGFEDFSHAGEHEARLAISWETGAPLALRAASASVKIGSGIQVLASGGTPPYSYSVLAGGGIIGPGGFYRAPASVGSVTLRVADSASATADLTLSITGADYVVTSNGDADDADPDDGVCSTESGECTLRAAITQAAATHYLATVGIPAGMTVALGSTLVLKESMHLVGGDRSTTIIDGKDASRVIKVGLLPRVLMSGFTVQSGNQADDGGGGGVGFEGSASAWFRDMSFRNNRVTGTHWASTGGAIKWWSSPTHELNIERCLFSGNTGGAQTGGALATYPVDGGASGPVTIVDSEFMENVAVSGTGAVDIIGAISNGTVNLERNLFVGNVGDVAAVSIRNFISGSLVSNTFSANQSSNFGAVAIGNDTDISLTNNTFVDNVSDRVTGGAALTAHDNTVPVTLRNNLFRNNRAVDLNMNCGAPGNGLFSSRGNNLADTVGECGFRELDFPGADALLGELADHGGATRTHALLPGSPAIDAGSNVDCPATDQRGFERPVDGNQDTIADCDIGAYERQVADGPRLRK